MRLRLECARHRGRRVMERRGAIAYVVLAQSHRPQPITAPVAALWLPGTRPWAGASPRDQGCVLVVNHASYLDPWCWSQCCRPRSALCQAELAEQFFARILFRRLGTEFVERFDPQRGVEDTDRVRQAVRQGRSMLFFPEVPSGVRLGCGPFAWAPSWWRRRPACPGADGHHRYPLHLARRAVFPRRGTVAVTIGAPIMPRGAT